MTQQVRKRTYGQFYTEGNPFTRKPFMRWAKSIKLEDMTILEPFAGANNIIHTLQEMEICNKFVSYDIKPNNSDVRKLNTITKFPKGFKVAITNPPWLAKNSATRRKLNFPNDKYDDIYKLCLELCLKNCDYVAALVPASFLNSGLFQERLTTYILLHDTPFIDTVNPVCLALFNNQVNKKVKIYHDNSYIGTLNSLHKELPQPKYDRQIKFNDPKGELGFISFDNTREPSIRFCETKDIENYAIKNSSRFITRIGGEFENIPALTKQLNHGLRAFRETTNDVFLTPFKGIRQDGKYRRRMDYALARKFINAS